MHLASNNVLSPPSSIISNSNKIMLKQTRNQPGQPNASSLPPRSANREVAPARSWIPRSCPAQRRAMRSRARVGKPRPPASRSLPFHPKFHCIYPTRPSSAMAHARARPLSSRSCNCGSRSVQCVVASELARGAYAAAGLSGRHVMTTWSCCPWNSMSPSYLMRLYLVLARIIMPTNVSEMSA